DAGCPNRPHGTARLARIPGPLNASARVVHAELRGARIQARRPIAAKGGGRSALASSPPVGQGHVGLNGCHQRRHWGQEHGRNGELAGQLCECERIETYRKKFEQGPLGGPPSKVAARLEPRTESGNLPLRLLASEHHPMRLAYHVLDVFTNQRFGGNPLAVVLDADGLPPVRMQTIAREFNLSETVFVAKPENAAHSARVRIFTPTVEVPFAGHPTVGTAALLAVLKSSAPTGNGDALIVLEEEVGPVRVGVRLRAGAAPFAEFDAPRLPQESGALPPADRLAAALGLIPAEIGFE